jgi:hypothetical protein
MLCLERRPISFNCSPCFQLDTLLALPHHVHYLFPVVIYLYTTRRRRGDSDADPAFGGSTADAWPCTHALTNPNIRTRTQPCHIRPTSQ